MAGKGHYGARFRSLFGEVPVRVRRLFVCPCRGEGGAKSVSALDFGKDAVAPELAYVTARYVEVGSRSHLVLPYAFDTNDMHFHQGTQRFATASQFAEYVIDTFDQLWREGGRMMSVGLHLRMIGRAGRIAGLERVLRHMKNRGGAWLARRDEIARHWLQHFS